MQEESTEGSKDKILMQRCELYLNKKYSTNYKKIMGKEKQRKRSKTEIEETEQNLKVYITATDNSALRASINATLRDINSIESALAAVKTKKL